MWWIAPQSQSNKAKVQPRTAILAIRHGLDARILVTRSWITSLTLSKRIVETKRFAGSFLLLFNHGVDRRLCRDSKSTHGTRWAVRDKDDLSQLLIHCKYIIKLWLCLVFHLQPYLHFDIRFIWSLYAYQLE